MQGSFTAKVVRTCTTYTITPRMFVSGLLPYNSASTSVDSNLRFRWEYQPGSELFVVYTDDYDSDPRANAVALRNRDCREVQPAVPAVATWASGKLDQQYEWSGDTGEGTDS